MRRGLHRQYRGAKIARYRAKGHPDPDQSDASRRMRLRSGNGRRRGHSDPNSTHLFRARMLAAWIHAAGARRIRNWNGFFAGGSAGKNPVRRHGRKMRARTGLDGAGMARHADQRRHDRARGAKFAALHRTDFRPARAGNGSGRAGTQALRDAEAGGIPGGRIRAKRERDFSTSPPFPRGPSFTKGSCWLRRSCISTRSWRTRT